MVEEKHKAILIFGPPGVGKGTQAKLLGKDPKYFHFSTGEMVRGTDPNSETGKTIRALIDQGNLVPDNLTVKLFYETIDNYIKDLKFNPKEQILILDGIPRNIPQAAMIKDRMDVRKIIYLNVDDPKILAARLAERAMIEGREDDKDESIIENRIKIYQEQTASVLEQYPAELIEEIDGTNTIKEIQQEIQEKEQAWGL